MRKITPVFGSELPKLPEGWRWDYDYIGNDHWMAYGLPGENGAEIGIGIDASGMMIGYDDDFYPQPVPFEVIAAVLKANGVEL